MARGLIRHDQNSHKKGSCFFLSEDKMVEDFLISCGKNHFKTNNTPLITYLTRNNCVLHQKQTFIKMGMEHTFC